MRHAGKMDEPRGKTLGCFQMLAPDLTSLDISSSLGPLVLAMKFFFVFVLFFSIIAD